MDEALNEVGRFISQVGFPVAVAGWLLWKTNGKLDRLASAVHRNTDATEQVADRMEAAAESIGRHADRIEDAITPARRVARGR